jgi:hypothetical protein
MASSLPRSAAEVVAHDTLNCWPGAREPTSISDWRAGRAHGDLAPPTGPVMIAASAAVLAPSVLHRLQHRMTVTADEDG